MRRGVLPLLLVGLVLVAFGYGVVQIFDLRFARGDVYPAYSTLRSDPLGARVLYESLDRMDNINIRRGEDPIKQFEFNPNSVFFYVAAEGLILPEKELISLEKFIKKGGRFVMTFYPQGRKSSLEKFTQPTPTPSPTATPAPANHQKEDEFPAEKVFFMRDIAARWEFGVEIEKKLQVKDAVPKIPDIDGAIPWHSAATFQKLGPSWRTIYAMEDLPVVIERPLGRGTIVLATDSYFLSNEAMQRDRRASFLSWLMGDKREVVFDEVHHGVREEAGVSTLIRRYRLGGFVIAALLTAILLCWKNVVRLVPASASRSDRDEFVSGKESFAGLTSLFRRNISPAHLAEVCYAEWNKSLPRSSRSVQLVAGRVRPMMEEFRRNNKTQRNPVEVYNEISRMIGEKKWKRST